MGCVRVIGQNPTESRALTRRFREVFERSTPPRTVHPMEEAVLVAAHDALKSAGLRPPLGTQEFGILLGVDEAIDGIKARYYADVLKDGPLGASPIAFPFTAPNSLAARISIAFDVRGENHTIAAGSLSGAQAIGLAVRAAQSGSCRKILVGAVGAVEQEWLDALRWMGQPIDLECGYGACCFVLEQNVRSDFIAELLGYSEAFGPGELREAILACLESAGMVRADVGAVRVAATHDDSEAIATVRQVGIRAEIGWSAGRSLPSASFPMAMAEAIAQREGETVLVIGNDCLSGAAAAVIRRRV
jgi:hypothetical protein